MTKADTDAIVTIGSPLPRLVSVVALGRFEVRVEWQAGTWDRACDVVDLSPAIHRYRVYAPLRKNPDLFRTVSLQDHRYGIAWGTDGAIDMGASTIADLAALMPRQHGTQPDPPPSLHGQQPPRLDLGQPLEHPDHEGRAEQRRQ